MRDVFGRALLSYYRGVKESIVLCRNDGNRNEFDLQTMFSPHDEWPEYERKALEHIEGRVLDIGCGAGRHSLWLQERGFDVVAIDISPLALKVSKARGAANPFLMAAQELGFAPHSFGTILLLGNNFGICGNVADTQYMMRQLCQIATKDCRVIATCRDVTSTTTPEHLTYQELNRKMGRPVGQITLRIEYKGEIGEWFDLLMVTPQEMQKICKPSGWVTDAIYRSENGLYAAVLRKKALPTMMPNHGT